MARKNKLPVKSFRISLALLLLVFLSGGTITKPSMSLKTEPAPVYESFYPHYFEICAVSQLSPYGRAKGGRHGHAVLYLKGACRDADGDYPKIKMCDEKGADLSDSETGVGISVDKMFRSVNWVAVPGKKLFFEGDLNPGQKLDQAHLEAVIRKVLELRLFKGVNLHEEYLRDKPETMSNEEYAAQQTVATDYALEFGRSVFCARIPVTRPMVEKAVFFLNELNDKYAANGIDYKWSGYSDNCAHTVHNALAAAGVWPSKSVNQIKVRQFFHLAIPANEFVELAFLTNLHSLAEKEIEGNEMMKKSLMEGAWLPARHGALLTVNPVHSPNELYGDQFTIFLLDRPFSEAKSQKVREMVKDKRFIDIESNLQYFDAQYQAALAASCRNSEPVSQKSEVFHAAYCQYLEQQSGEVRQQLNNLKSAEASA